MMLQSPGRDGIDRIDTGLTNDGSVCEDIISKVLLPDSNETSALFNCSELDQDCLLVTYSQSDNCANTNILNVDDGQLGLLTGPSECWPGFDGELCFHSAVDCRESDLQGQEAAVLNSLDTHGYVIITPADVPALPSRDSALQTEAWEYISESETVTPTDDENERMLSDSSQNVDGNHHLSIWVNCKPSLIDKGHSEQKELTHHYVLDTCNCKIDDCDCDIYGETSLCGLSVAIVQHDIDNCSELNINVILPKVTESDEVSCLETRGSSHHCSDRENKNNSSKYTLELNVEDFQHEPINLDICKMELDAAAGLLRLGTEATSLGSEPPSSGRGSTKVNTVSNSHSHCVDFSTVACRWGMDTDSSTDSSDANFLTISEEDSGNASSNRRRRRQRSRIHRNNKMSDIKRMQNPLSSLNASALYNDSDENSISHLVSNVSSFQRNSDCTTNVSNIEAGIDVCRSEVCSRSVNNALQHTSDLATQSLQNSVNNPVLLKSNSASVSTNVEASFSTSSTFSSTDSMFDSSDENSISSSPEFPRLNYSYSSDFEASVSSSSLSDRDNNGPGVANDEDVSSSYGRQASDIYGLSIDGSFDIEPPDFDRSFTTSSSEDEFDSDPNYMLTEGYNSGIRQWSHRKQNQQQLHSQETSPTASKINTNCNCTSENMQRNPCNTSPYDAGYVCSDNILCTEIPPSLVPSTNVDRTVVVLNGHGDSSSHDSKNAELNKQSTDSHKTQTASTYCSSRSYNQCEWSDNADHNNSIFNSGTRLRNREDLHNAEECLTSCGNNTLKSLQDILSDLDDIAGRNPNHVGVHVAEYDNRQSAATPVNDRTSLSTKKRLLPSSVAFQSKPDIYCNYNMLRRSISCPNTGSPGCELFRRKLPQVPVMKLQDNLLAHEHRSFPERMFCSESVLDSPVDNRSVMSVRLTASSPILHHFVDQLNENWSGYHRALNIIQTLDPCDMDKSIKTSTSDSAVDYSGHDVIDSIIDTEQFDSEPDSFNTSTLTNQIGHDVNAVASRTEVLENLMFSDSESELLHLNSSADISVTDWRVKNDLQNSVFCKSVNNGNGSSQVQDMLLSSEERVSHDVMSQTVLDKAHNVSDNDVTSHTNCNTGSTRETASNNPISNALQYIDRGISHAGGQCHNDRYTNSKDEGDSNNPGANPLRCIDNGLTRARDLHTSDHHADAMQENPPNNSTSNSMGHFDRVLSNAGNLFTNDWHPDGYSTDSESDISSVDLLLHMYGVGSSDDESYEDYCFHHDDQTKREPCAPVKRGHASGDHALLSSDFGGHLSDEKISSSDDDDASVDALFESLGISVNADSGNFQRQSNSIEIATPAENANLASGTIHMPLQCTSEPRQSSSTQPSQTSGNALSQNTTSTQRQLSRLSDVYTRISNLTARLGRQDLQPRPYSPRSGEYHLNAEYLLPVINSSASRPFPTQRSSPNLVAEDYLDMRPFRHILNILQGAPSMASPLIDTPSACRNPVNRSLRNLHINSVPSPSSLEPFEDLSLAIDRYRYRQQVARDAGRTFSSSTDDEPESNYNHGLYDNPPPYSELYPRGATGFTMSEPPPSYFDVTHSRNQSHVWRTETPPPPYPDELMTSEEDSSFLANPRQRRRKKFAQRLRHVFNKLFK